MTWLHVPPSCLSAPALADSTSGSDSPATPALWVTLSGMPTLRPSSWRGWRTRGWRKLLSGTTSPPSTAARGVESWISSLRDSRASLPARQESGSGLTTSGGSGPRSSESSASARRPSYSLRTCQASFPFAEGFEPFSGDWPRSGTMRSGERSARPRSERPTYGSEFSSWATPQAADGGKVSKRTTLNRPDGTPFQISLTQQAVRLQWPTPDTSDRGQGPSQDSRNSLTIERAAQHWATPAARDAKGHTITAAHPDGFNKTLSNEAALWATPTTQDAENTQAALWPTPQAHDAVGGKTPEQVEAMRLRTGAGVRNLNETAAKWPTPDANAMNDGENPETWRARQARLKVEKKNGNGAGVPLAVRAAEASIHLDPTTPKDGALTSSGGRVLNPLFCEALQNWPLGWSCVCP